MDLKMLLKAPPKTHVRNGETHSAWRLANGELRFIDAHVSAGMKTLETGCGVSTVLFGIKNTRHICIAPLHEETTRIKDYCDQHSVSYENIDFVNEVSEKALPEIKEGGFDLVLLDGRHGFPQPFFDWYYVAGLMKVGGYLIIDDLHIWTCETLKQFLLDDDSWEFVQENFRAAVFIKTGEGSQDKEWVYQRYQIKHSKHTSALANISHFFQVLRRGKLKLFFTYPWPWIVIAPFMRIFKKL